MSDEVRLLIAFSPLIVLASFGVVYILRGFGMWLEKKGSLQ